MPNVLTRAPLALHVEVVTLDFETLADPRVAVTAGLDLDLVGTDGEVAASVSGTFRLVYVMAPKVPVATGGEQRAFATQVALADAWPVWRVWANGMLAAMGLGPPPLPAHLPSHLIADGEDAYDATRQVKAETRQRTP